MTDYPALFQQGTDSNETLATIINQLITAAKERAVASGITYDNATSGLLATEVKAAIDELVTSLSLKAPLADPTFTGNPKGPNPTESTGLANKQWVESITINKTGFPNYGAKYAIPNTVNLVHHADKDGYVFAIAFDNSNLQLAITDEMGSEIFNNILIVGTGTIIASTGLVPIKKDTYFKVTSFLGTTSLLFIPTY